MASVHDENHVPNLVAVSNADGTTPVNVWADPTTHRLLVNLPAGSGTVTSVSVVSANGLAGTVATATTTPAITLSTTVTGIVKGNGTAFSAAVAETDYVTPTGTGTLSNKSLSDTTTNFVGAVDATKKLNVSVAGQSTTTTGVLASSFTTGKTLTFPDATDTLVGKATTDTLTNKTLDTAGAGNVLKINGTQVSAVTGTGSVVLSTSPTLTTAALGSSTATTQTPADNSTKLATTAYVDNAVLGQNFKEAAKWTTTAALPANTYSNGASGVGATLTAVATGVLTVDGNTVALNDRVLVKNEATGANNGLYLCTTAGAVGVAYILTRATDSDTSLKWKTGDSVFTTSGTSNSATTWAYTGIDSPTIGTTALTFAQVAGQGSFSAGNGIAITGNSIAIDTTVTVDKTTAQTLTNKTLTTPIIASISNTGTLTLPTSTDTLVGKATTDTLTNKTLTSPKIGTSVLDTNGNTLVNIGVAASAVNFVKVTNAATGTAGPVLSADGETNVDLKLSGKGTGAVHHTSGVYGDITADTDGVTITVNWATSNIHSVTLAGNRTLAFSNDKAGQVIILRVKQDATGGRTLTYPATVSWQGGSAPTLSAANKTDTLGFLCITPGSAWSGYVVGQNE